MRDVELRSEPVELYKILKFEGLASSGGQAKAMIADGLVQVNGVVELQKRKKIVIGDTIVMADEVIRLVAESATSQTSEGDTPA